MIATKKIILASSSVRRKQLLQQIGLKKFEIVCPKFDEEKYEMKFLYYLLQRHNLPSMAKGVKPGINRNDVYALKVKIPSIEVQQQIVRELDVMVQQVTELMEISRKKSQHYLNLKQSTLQEAFNGNL